MSAPRPAANAVDLSMFAQRARLDRAVATYTSRAAQLRTEGVPVDLMLLTARFEVVVAYLAQATGTDPDALMQEIDEHSIDRALAQLDALGFGGNPPASAPRSAAPVDEEPEE